MDANGIKIEQITRTNLEAFMQVRLEALRESPLAFASTYAREVAFDEAEWLRRLERWDGVKGIGFLAMDREAGCGIAGGLLKEGDASRAVLVSMWTAPAYRKSGVGRMLVEAVLEWAKSRGVKVLELLVTGTNDKAIRFYERMGFTMTGWKQPFPTEPTLEEYEMVRPVR